MDPRLGLVGTILIAILGGGVAAFAGMPAAWLSGAMIAVTAASLAGWDTRLPPRLVDFAYLLIGTALGCGVTPELLSGALAWPLSLLGLAITVAAVIVAVRVFLTRVAGWDRDTAFFSAVPGALSFVLAMASESDADIRKVATSQSIRVFLLVAVLPGLIVAVETDPPLPAVVPEGSLAHTVLMIVAAAVVGLLFRRLGVPSGLLTGSFMASALLHGSGLVSGAPPAPLVVLAFVLLGALVGSRFAGTSLRFVAGILAASIGAFLVATTIAGLMAVGVARIIGVPIDQAIVAYAPGGLDAMMSLSLALNMDTAFVAAHQFARFAGIAIALPFVVPKRRIAIRMDTSGKED